MQRRVLTEHAGQLHVRDELVERRLDPHQRAHRRRILPRHPHEPGQRRQGQPEHRLKGEVRKTDEPPDPAHHSVDQVDQRHEGEQHGAHVECQAEAVPRPARCRVDDVHVRLLDLLDQTARGLGLAVLRIHHLGHHQRRRRGHDRRRHQVPGDVREIRDEEADVGRHHPARHRREARGHHRVQLRHGHLLDEGLDEEGRLGLAHEDVARRGEGLGPRGAHGALHHPGHPAHHELHHAQVIQNRHQRGQEDDRGQDREGHVGAGVGNLSRDRVEVAVAGLAGADGDVVVDQVAEDEARPLERVAKQPHHHGIGPLEDRQADGRLEDEEGEDQLERDAPGHDPPGDGAPVHAEGPGQRAQRQHAEQRTQALGEGGVQSLGSDRDPESRPLLDGRRRRERRCAVCSGRARRFAHVRRGCHDGRRRSGHIGRRTGAGRGSVDTRRQQQGAYRPQDDHPAPGARAQPVGRAAHGATTASDFAPTAAGPRGRWSEAEEGMCVPVSGELARRPRCPTRSGSDRATDSAFR